MENMTIKGVTTTNTLGQEQYEMFTRKIGRKTKRYCAYDYRHLDGELFGIDSIWHTDTVKYYTTKNIKYNLQL